MHYDVHSRPHCVGRASAAFVIKTRNAYGVHSRPHCVGRTSAARQPHAVDFASDRSDHSDASAACGRWRNGSYPHTIEVRNELWWCLLCIDGINAQSAAPTMNYYASAARVGRNASAARRPRVCISAGFVSASSLFLPHLYLSVLLASDSRSSRPAPHEAPVQTVQYSTVFTETSMHDIWERD